MNQNQQQLLDYMKSGNKVNHIKIWQYRTIICDFRYHGFDGVTVYGEGYKKWTGGGPYKPVTQEINGNVSFDLEKVARWQK